MKQSVFVILGFILLVSCSGPVEHDWKQTSSDRILLFTRPDGFSGTTTHSDSEVQGALQEQESYIKEFERKFGVKFSGTITIYLYNTDEVNVQASIGGGNTDVASSTIYYRFFPTSLNANGSHGPMGGHEIFHVLASKTFGVPSSRLLGEGGAVWFDGAYGTMLVNGVAKRRPIHAWLGDYVKNGQVKSASELISDVTTIDEGTFYPQAGLVIQWIVERFGLAQLVTLMRHSAESHSLEKAIGEVYGLTIDQLNSLGETSKYKSFDEWSDTVHGPQKTKRFYDLIMDSNRELFKNVLNLSSDEVDTLYAKWLAEQAKFA